LKGKAFYVLTITNMAMERNSEFLFHRFSTLLEIYTEMYL